MRKWKVYKVYEYELADRLNWLEQEGSTIHTILREDKVNVVGVGTTEVYTVIAWK